VTSFTTLFQVQALLPLQSQQISPLINARGPATSGLPCTTLVIAFSTRDGKAYGQDSATHHAVTPQALLHPALLKLGLLAVLVGVRLQTPRNDLWPLLIPIQAADYLLPEGSFRLPALDCSRRLLDVCHCISLEQRRDSRGISAPCMQPTAEGLAGCRPQRPAPRGTPRRSTSASSAPADSWTCGYTVSKPGRSRTCWNYIGAPPTDSELQMKLI
jgi:hypothetical protein